jgi:hypothetical protein
MWSSQQHAMLEAMGYTLYIRPELIPVSQVGAASAVKATDHSHAAQSEMNVKLFHALQKAAPGKDIAILNIDVQALRSSPLAKRTLWPQLRALLKE